ncbi:MAG: hypothetical protein Q9220_004892 [cf. Caloplaca sp. 1 TL-2023]
MDPPKDDLKWFGEGFEGFPKILPDDCVYYAVHIVAVHQNSLEVKTQLRKIQAAATALCKSFLRDYIWQRDSFKLDVKHQAGQYCLQGHTNYGDAIEDEWLVVFLLRELSKQFSQCWIRVVDADGEFLLVEAADALPKWLNPEVAEHRVWINDGHLFIIPKSPKDPKALQGALKLSDALSFIQDRPSHLLHDRTLELEAFHRLRKYPAQIKHNLHHAFISIPRTLAHVLHQNSAYISPAVEAFYLRDPIALRPLQSLKLPKLSFPPNDFVTVSTRFTKVGFAQVRGQVFDVPPAWRASNPASSDSFNQPLDEMGMKVTCGFEMLLSDPQNVDKKSVREIQLILEDVSTGEDDLPSNEEISQWEKIQDDEGWLDINFDDFDKELSGKREPKSSGQDAGFGDKTAQENIRRLVSRFEKFLDDDNAEFLDDMDQDNDDDDGDDDSSDALSGSVAKLSDNSIGEGEMDFDERRLVSLMRDMMGSPLIDSLQTPESISKRNVDAELGTTAQDMVDISDEEEEIRKVMHGMGNELRDAGALETNTDPLKKALEESPK